MFTSLVVLPVKKFVQSNPPSSLSNSLLRTSSFSLPSHLSALSHHFLGSSRPPLLADQENIDNRNSSSFHTINDKEGMRERMKSPTKDSENGGHNNQLTSNRNIQTDHSNGHNLNLDQKKRSLPSFVKIVEVGPRDGLQAEPVIIATSVKVNLINLLSASGLKVIEATSFVHPVMVPQMGDNSTVFNEIVKEPGVNYPVLVPNITGLNNAIKVGVKEIAVFAAATDSFSM